MLQLILLDQRSFKTETTLLGKVQWDWLRLQLTQPADLRVLVSPLQFLAEGSEPWWWEKWANWESERTKMISLLSVALLTGDRHLAGFYSSKSSITSTLGQPLVEITSSSLTHSYSEIPALGNTASRLPKDHPAHHTVCVNNYGLLEVNWVDRVVTASLMPVQKDATKALASYAVNFMTGAAAQLTATPEALTQCPANSALLSDATVGRNTYFFLVLTLAFLAP